jgi:hypothetical protein
LPEFKTPQDPEDAITLQESESGSDILEVPKEVDLPVLDSAQEILLAYQLDPGKSVSLGNYRLVIPPLFRNGLNELKLTFRLNSELYQSGFIISEFESYSQQPLVVDAARQERGLHVVVIDPVHGTVADVNSFDTYHSNESRRAADFLRALPAGTIVAMAGYADVMFRGREWVETLVSNFNADIHWDNAWKDGTVHPLFRSSFLFLGVRVEQPSASSMGWLKVSSRDAVELNVDRGDTIPGTRLAVPFKLGLVSAGANTGKPRAHIYTPRAPLQYGIIEQDSINVKTAASEGKMQVLLTLSEPEAIAKVRIGGIDPSTGSGSYRVMALDPKTNKFVDFSPPIRYRGKPENVRFYEVEPFMTQQLRVEATRTTETYTTFNINLFTSLPH